MPAVSRDVVVRPGRSPLVVDLIASGRLTAWLLLVGCWPGLGCRASRRVFVYLLSLARLTSYHSRHASMLANPTQLHQPRLLSGRDITAADLARRRALFDAIIRMTT